MTDESPIYSPFFGVMGATSAMVFGAMGAAYGTAKSGTGIAAMAVMRPEAIMKSIIPVVMAGIIAIYGVVVAVLIAGELDAPPSTPYTKGSCTLAPDCLLVCPVSLQVTLSESLVTPVCAGPRSNPDSTSE